MSIQDTVNADLSMRLARALQNARTRADLAKSEGKSTKAKVSGREASNVVALRKDMTDTTDTTKTSSERWPLPGLAPMTRVRTSFGDVHAIALRKGDDVLTRSGDYRPILWINRIKLDETFLAQKPDSNPVVIGAGALGQTGDLMVSPRQVICGDGTSGLSEAREASMLVSHPGVRRLRETGLTYTLFHVGEEAEVYCEGLYLNFPMEA